MTKNQMIRRYLSPSTCKELLEESEVMLNA